MIVSSSAVSNPDQPQSCRRADSKQWRDGDGVHRTSVHREYICSREDCVSRLLNHPRWISARRFVFRPPFSGAISQWERSTPIHPSSLHGASVFTWYLALFESSLVIAMHQMNDSLDVC
jgi:hypothetical protein